MFSIVALSVICLCTFLHQFHHCWTQTCRRLRGTRRHIDSGVDYIGTRGKKSLLLPRFSSSASELRRIQLNATHAISPLQNHIGNSLTTDSVYTSRSRPNRIKFVASNMQLTPRISSTRARTRLPKHVKQWQTSEATAQDRKA